MSDDPPLYAEMRRSRHASAAHGRPGGGRHQWRTQPDSDPATGPIPRGDAVTQPEHVQTADPRRKLGKLPPHADDADHPRVRLAPFLDRAAADGPPLVDWMSRVTSWPMYANDRWGCCAWAMKGHAIQAVSTYGRGATITVSETDVLAAYSGCTGFDPNRPETDQGTVLQDGLNYWRKTGVGGHKILAFAQVDHRDPVQVNAALRTFGSLLVGIEFPDSAQAQFESGRPWDVVGRRPKIEGGHAIHVGYDGAGYVCTTWGRPQPVTDAFWKTFVDECWVAVTPEWFAANGRSPSGLDLVGLGAEVARLTGGPNPFQDAPTPTPKPAPPVSPSAPPSDPVAFLRWLRDLLNQLFGGR